jgi:hypothetical protein
MNKFLFTVIYMDLLTGENCAFECEHDDPDVYPEEVEEMLYYPAFAKFDKNPTESEMNEAISLMEVIAVIPGPNKAVFPEKEEKVVAKKVNLRLVVSNTIH